MTINATDELFSGLQSVLQQLVTEKMPPHIAVDESMIATALHHITNMVSSDILSKGLTNHFYLGHYIFALSDTSDIISSQLDMPYLIGSVTAEAGKPFSDFLPQGEADRFHKLAIEMQQGRDYCSCYPFLVVNEMFVEISSYCCFYRLSDLQMTIAAGLILVPKTELLIADNAFERLQNSDSELFHKTCRYIITHCPAPLPALKKLALLMGTNEFSLKAAFRNNSTSGVHGFYLQERLKRAKRMLLYSNTPLKRIAADCGFNSYPHFSKAFKKLFGENPGDVIRTPF